MSNDKELFVFFALYFGILRSDRLVGILTAAYGGGELPHYLYLAHHADKPWNSSYLCSALSCPGSLAALDWGYR